MGTGSKFATIIKKIRTAMKKILVWILLGAAFVFSASTCEKMEPGDYHDYQGNKINLLGPWVLTEIQLKTAGVIESKTHEPESVMEFAEKGLGYTKDLAGEVLDTWHYETFRAAVTIFTNEEWANNRGLGVDDSRYERGKTYYFHVVDAETISSEEKVSANTSAVYFYTRFNPLSLRVKVISEELYSPNTLIISYDTEVGKDPLIAAVQAYGAEIKYDYSIIPSMAIRIPDGTDIHKAIAWFKNVKGVTSVARDQIYRLTDPVRPRLEVR